MTKVNHHHQWPLIAVVVLLAHNSLFGSILSGQDQVTQQLQPLRVLLFSKTAGFRHSSIPTGIQAIKLAAKENDIEVVATEDAEVFTDKTLVDMDVIVFLNTTGDVLDKTQQEAMQRFIQGGGGWVGIHGAADTEYDWPWYGKMMGAYFAGHPAVQRGQVVVQDKTHPAMAHLPTTWERVDEWYDYRDVPDQSVQILATLDEGSYEGGGMGASHPIVWCHDYDGGRAFYTGGGHTDESFADPLFIKHIIEAIQWSAGSDVQTLKNWKPTIESKQSSGQPPLTVQFTAVKNRESDQELSYAWDFNSDGEIDSRVKQTFWTFHQRGKFLVRLFISDESGSIGAMDSWIVVGNTSPTVTFIKPEDGGVVSPDQWFQYDILIDDPEEQSPDVNRVVVELYQSGDPYGKPIVSRTGSSGQLKIPPLLYEKDNPSQDMFLLARYADQGVDDENRLIGHSVLTLRAHEIRPNLMDTSEGLQRVDISNEGNASAFVAVNKGWVSLDPLCLAGIEDIVFSLKPSVKSSIEIRRDDPEGTLVSIVRLQASAEEQGWTNVTALIGDPGGSSAYFFVFRGPPDRSLFLMRSLHLRGPGISSPSPEKTR